MVFLIALNTEFQICQQLLLYRGCPPAGQGTAGYLKILAMKKTNLSCWIYLKLISSTYSRSSTSYLAVHATEAGLDISYSYCLVPLNHFYYCDCTLFSWWSNLMLTWALETIQLPVTSYCQCKNSNNYVTLTIQAGSVIILQPRMDYCDLWLWSIACIFSEINIRSTSLSGQLSTL